MCLLNLWTLSANEGKTMNELGGGSQPLTKHLIEPQAIDDNGITEFEIEMAEK